MSRPGAGPEDTAAPPPFSQGRLGRSSSAGNHHRCCGDPVEGRDRRPAAANMGGMDATFNAPPRERLRLCASVALMLVLVAVLARLVVRLDRSCFGPNAADCLEYRQHVGYPDR